MLYSPIAWKIQMTFGLALLALAVAHPAAVQSQEAKLGGFVTVEQLALEDSRPEDRIARYEAALASATGPDEKLHRRGLPGFQEIVADFSALSDPEDAFAAAHNLTGTLGSRQVYEEAGVGLLRAARLARFAQEDARALHHLRAARHAFALADREKSAEGAATGSKDFLHRAMVPLEEVLVADSDEPWKETFELLAKQLEVTPTGAVADWALRISNDPETYVSEPFPAPDTEALYVGGDIRPPVKVFAPGSRYTEIARKARIQGVVIIQAVIDRHGSVSALKMLKGLPMGLSEEAMRTMATWLFEPATLHGQPVTVYYNLTLNFRL